MNNTLLETLIATLIGSIITIGSLSMPAEDIIKSATSATNGANLHQIATVLELYYSDHQSYPIAQDGQKLIDELKAQEYITTVPLDASVFIYTVKNNGQDYSLRLK
ncbi:MAG: hypothetical protein AAB972_00090 [Patescibacteria group bacterium]